MQQCMPTQQCATSTKQNDPSFWSASGDTFEWHYIPHPNHQIVPITPLKHVYINRFQSSQNKHPCQMTDKCGRFRWCSGQNTSISPLQTGSDLQDSHIVSEFGCQLIINLTGFLWILWFPPASKIGFLSISLSRLIWFSLLCCNCSNLYSTTVPRDPTFGYKSYVTNLCIYLII